MSDLTEFLLARIAEDEADIKALGTAAVGHSGRCIYEGGYEGTMDCDCGAVERAKAECEAKRRIVELHTDRDGECRICDDGWWDESDDGSEIFSPQPEAYPCRTLRLLALPHADHPEYREEWRV